MNSVLQYVLYVGILVAVAIQWPSQVYCATAFGMS